MVTFRIFVFILLLLISVTTAEGVKITYNTTVPRQFSGLESFERQVEVRVIFRAEPIDILPGEKTNLNFRVENPTPKDHLVSVKLVDIPEGFLVVDGEFEKKKIVPPESIDIIVFELSSNMASKPRTYWYGFDVIDEELGDDQAVVNTSKLLNTYHGLNVILEPETPAPIETTPPEEKEKAGGLSKNRIFLFLVFILILVLAILLRDRIKR